MSHSSEDDLDTLLRKSIKTLLIQLAARSESPGSDLQEILEEVIQELHDEATEVYGQRRPNLRLVDREPGPT